MNTKILFIITVLSALFVSCNIEKNHQVRLSKNINANWTFNYFPQSQPDTTIAQLRFDDSKWQAVAIPHTWSTYETTGEVHPFIYNASERDDSYWWYGWGCYRKKFNIDSSLKDKKLFVEFDGVQKYSKVYLNGKYLGDHKGGFTGFYFDLTDRINYERENVLTVFVSNRRNDKHQIPPMTAGNWNLYGGIYRDVRLVVKNKVYIPFQGSYKHEGGTFVTTPKVSHKNANVNVRTWVKNENKNTVLAELQTTIVSPSGKIIAVKTEKKEIKTNELTKFNQDFDYIQQPELWSPQNPALYSVKSEVFVNSVLTDEYTSPLGFRFFYWDYGKNDLYLNGKKMNILGTNRHQEYPWLGDAIPKWISRMDMEDIKYNLGHNFIRLAHYPNDKYLYQLADSFGIVTVEEVPNIKNIDFNETVQEQNVREMIRRDRNHPSILFWSMGNETNDAADSKWAVEEDTTRIIHLRKGNEGGKFIQHTHDNLDMENLLRVTIRGWFDVNDSPKGFSSEPENGQQSSNETWQHKMARVKAGSVRGLLGDNCVSWLYEDHGADREYLNCILKHINPKGWVDMYRQPKYIYWLTKAYYTDHPTIFIHPHFWREKYVGQNKDIVIDSNCEEVELFINGKSAGKKYPSKKTFNTITFENIPVQKGNLKAVGFKDGKKYVYKLAMPGKPKKIILSTQEKKIKADRSGIAIILANIVDKNGNPVFDATNTLEWSVTGPGKLVGAPVYESDIQKHEEMEGTGYTVVPVANVVRSTNKPGKIKVMVTSPGLEPAQISIDVFKIDEATVWLSEPGLSDSGRLLVTRDTTFMLESNLIQPTILPISGNEKIVGNGYNELRKNIDKFIGSRNQGNYNRYAAYPFLVNAIAKRLSLTNGEMIADDYNFLINQFNTLVVIEKYIDTINIPETDKIRIKKEYAYDVMVKGKQIDLKEELNMP
jgi:hypothetical protein